MRTSQALQIIVPTLALVAALGFLTHSLLNSSAPVASPPSPVPLASVPLRIRVIATPMPTPAPGPDTVAPKLQTLETEPLTIPKNEKLPPAPTKASPAARIPEQIVTEQAMRELASRPLPSRRPKKAPPVAAVPRASTPSPKQAEPKALSRTSSPENSGVTRAVATAALPANSDHSGNTGVLFSKEEMTVTISGDQAWVQVSPTRTMPARKGDVLPNIGKILEIRKNEVVAENGTLTTN